MDDEAQRLAVQVLDACRERGLMVATAESCTGGLVAAALTAIPGSSTVVERGFVTYTNEAKIEMLGVRAAMIDAVGAVSPETAEAMAWGALTNSRAQIAVSVTGIAGPGGATETKPVGLVHFAAASEDGRLARREERFGDIGRDEVRRRSVIVALHLLLLMASEQKPQQG
ncbi:MAG: CinA family protein [Phreatobacter sp.]|uniref:CinA family protein n=1 Tax=Phreatobacter sp. TaxID=1966341 RepID=UPI001A54316E|nr:CinA family protein [Phreatobacter sp.]